MQDPLLLGVVGWSGSGKTTLLKRVLPLLAGRGLRVTTLKHAHHEFDVDVPGKDSWEHRQAGASEVIVCSARRWVQMHELHDESEPTLAQLVRRASPCDLIHVEGYKRENHPKLEVFRPSLGKQALYLEDPRVLSIATDDLLPGTHPPLVDLNDAEAVAQRILDDARPLRQVLDSLRVA